MAAEWELAWLFSSSSLADIGSFDGFGARRTNQFR